MQRVMLRLDALVSRRRRWVLLAWVVILAAAIPFAARQSDHLSSGGFTVPGSQSQRVADAAPATSLSIVVTERRDLRALIRRAQTVDRVTGAGKPVTRRGVSVIPLQVDANDDDATDVAIALREEL